MEVRFCVQIYRFVSSAIELEYILQTIFGGNGLFTQKELEDAATKDVDELQRMNTKRIH